MTEDMQKELSNLVKRAKGAYKITEFYKISGISVSYLSKAINLEIKSKPKIKTLFLIAKYSQDSSITFEKLYKIFGYDLSDDQEEIQNEDEYANIQRQKEFSKILRCAIGLRTEKVFHELTGLSISWITRALNQKIRRRPRMQTLHLVAENSQDASVTIEELCKIFNYQYNSHDVKNEEEVEVEKEKENEIEEEVENVIKANVIFSNKYYFENELDFEEEFHQIISKKLENIDCMVILVHDLRLYNALITHFKIVENNVTVAIY